MNALSQISQITQLVVEIGAGCEHHLQACIDALKEHQRIIKSMKEEEEERLRLAEEAKKVSAKKIKKPKKVEMAECGECGVRCRKDDLLESEVRDWAVFCEDCFNTLFLKCDRCCDEVERDEGEWVSVKHNQPFLNKEYSFEYCLSCFNDDIEEFLPEYKTDTFEFDIEGGTCYDDISSSAERHAEMVAEMKWCLKCDLCPQNDKNDKNLCGECYFQHGAEDDEEEEEEECKCGKPLYDMLFNYKEGTFCKCREE